MDHLPPALPHGPLEPVFTDVFHVTGAMEAHIQGADWAFGRNMVVVREGERLVLINTVRLNEAGLEALDTLGTVTDVVRLGGLHGRDDAFYVHRYGARLWQPPAVPDRGAPPPDRTLTPDGPLPLDGASLFAFTTTAVPETVLHLDRDGGILIACDALQNWEAPDDYTPEDCRALMTEMGFYTRANVGPVWIAAAEPGAADFAALKQWSFRHALCGHGTPVRDDADAAFAATFQRLYGV